MNPSTEQEDRYITLQEIFNKTIATAIESSQKKRPVIHTTIIEPSVLIREFISHAIATVIGRFQAEFRSNGTS